MSDNNSKPVYVGKSESNDFGALFPEVVSLDGNVRVRLRLVSGEEIILPADILSLLGQNSLRMGQELKFGLEQARLAKYHPSQRHSADALTDIRISKNSSHKKFASSESVTSYIKTGGNQHEDSTPYIMWKTNEANIPGWALCLIGVENSIIGWAAWDDQSGVDELIASMSDVETCVAISGMMSPTETAQMSARIAAKALRTGRKLPGINNTKVRIALAAKEGIISPVEINNWSAAQIKLLTISSGDKKIPVAVAITPPRKFVNQRELTNEELKDISWSDRRKLENDILKPLIEKWSLDAKQAMIDAGWRTLDLPSARGGHSSSSEQITWFTLIEPELWSNVSAAAHEIARNFFMTRSTRI